MVFVMMLVVFGLFVIGINGREEVEEVDGVIAEGVIVFLEEIIQIKNIQEEEKFSNVVYFLYNFKKFYLKFFELFGMFQILQS